MKTEILYATETTKSEMLSYDMEELAKDYGECSVRSIDELQVSEIEPGTLFIFVISTHGDGDLPVPGEHFVDAVKKAAPDLTGVEYSVFGLGDTIYEATYNWGCRKITKLMAEHKATMVGELGLHDDSGYEEPEEIGLPWLKEILEGYAKAGSANAA